jgi:hypothetical protein
LLAASSLEFVWSPADTVSGLAMVLAVLVTMAKKGYPIAHAVIHSNRITVGVLYTEL